MNDNLFLATLKIAEGLIPILITPATEIDVFSESANRFLGLMDQGNQVANLHYGTGNNYDAITTCLATDTLILTFLTALQDLDRTPEIRQMIDHAAGFRESTTAIMATCVESEGRLAHLAGLVH